MARILIQRIGSGQFYKHPGQWVREKDKATAFLNSIEAWEFCTRHQLREVNLLMDFGDPQFDVALSIPSCSAPPPPNPMPPG